MASSLPPPQVRIAAGGEVVSENKYAVVLRGQTVVGENKKRIGRNATTEGKTILSRVYRFPIEPPETGLRHAVNSSPPPDKTFLAAAYVRDRD